MSGGGSAAPVEKAAPLSARRDKKPKLLQSTLRRQKKKNGLFPSLLRHAVVAAVVSIILYQTFFFLDSADPVQIVQNSWSKQIEIDKRTRIPTGKMIDEIILYEFMTECELDTYGNLSVETFFAKYHGKKPVKFRSPNYPNVDIFKEIERNTLLEKYGNVLVNVGTTTDGTFTLDKPINAKRSLKQVVHDISTWPPIDVYFSDSVDGEFIADARRVIGSTPIDAYRPPPHFTGIAKEFAGTAPRFTLGGGGGGLAFHQRTSSYTELFLGAQRWSLYGPGNAPVHQGYSPFRPHSSWLNSSKLPQYNDSSPLECVQGPGEVVYVPDDWLRATLLLRPTISIVRNAKSALPGTAMYFQNKAVRLMDDERRHKKATAEELRRAEKFLRRALILDPTNARYYAQLSVALSKQQKYVAGYGAIQKGLSLNNQSAFVRHKLVHLLLELDTNGVVIENEETGKPIDWLVTAYETSVEQHENFGNLGWIYHHFDFINPLTRIADEIDKEYPVREHILSDGTHLTGDKVRVFILRAAQKTWD